MTSRIPVHAIDATGYVGDGSRRLADDGTWKAAGAGGGVASVVPGAGITVDNTDPANPVVSATGSGGSGTDYSTLTLPLTKTWTADIPNGIFDHLGMVKTRGASYSNPSIGGAGLYANVPAHIAVAQSGNQDGTRTADKAFDHLLGAGDACTHTNDVANSWWRVDFLAAKRFTVTRLAIVGRDSGGYHPRNFKLQGSDDTSTWTDLLTVAGSGPNDNAWWSSAVVGAGAFRYVRILQTGANSNGTNHLVMGEVEMWGVLSAA